MKDIDQIKANLGAINAVIQSLIESHPDRLALAQKIRTNGEKTETMLLDSTVPDDVIEKTKEILSMFAYLASPL